MLSNRPRLKPPLSSQIESDSHKGDHFQHLETVEGKHISWFTNAEFLTAGKQNKDECLSEN